MAATKALERLTPHALRRDSGQGSRLTETLRISEIFYSLQGETSRVGLPTVFIRLTGCPLRCVYCDTEYAFYGGEGMSLSAILDEVSRYAPPTRFREAPGAGGGAGRAARQLSPLSPLPPGERGGATLLSPARGERSGEREGVPAALTCPGAPRYVTVTGGEPLAQKACVTLLKKLCDAGYSVSLETGGALDVSKVDARVSKILDIKTPGSGEVEKNRWSNLDYLTPHDEIKFVLCDEADYQWAKRVLKDRRLDEICPVLFSPVYHRLNPTHLADWVLRDRLPVRMQIQLHKVLWGEGRGR